MRVLLACDRSQSVDAIAEEMLWAGLPTDGKALVLCVGQTVDPHRLAETAKEKIVPPRYEVGAIFEVSSRASDGIEEIKKALTSAAHTSSATEIAITYVGAPRYRLRVTADDYKQADKVMNGVLDRVKENIGKHGTFSFKKEMSRKYGGAT